MDGRGEGAVGGHDGGGGRWGKCTEEDFQQKIESMNLDPRLKKLLLTYEEVFGALPPPLSCKKLVQMDLKLKPEFEKTRVRRRPYLCGASEHCIQNALVLTGLVLEGASVVMPRVVRASGAVGQRVDRPERRRM